MQRIEHISAVLIGLLLVTIPFMMGDFKELARVEIVVVGMILWVLLLWNGLSVFSEYKVLSLFALVSLLGVGIYSIPLPTEWLQGLSGREIYQDVVVFNESKLQTLSLIPQDSFLSFVYVSAMVAIFFSMLRLPFDTIKILLIILGCIVVFEAALGIIQYASGVDSFYIGMQEHGNTASGTYRNRDHYVALLEMAIPLIVAFIAIKPSKNEKESWIGRTLILSIVLILVVVAAILSGSRAGIALAISGLFVSAFIMSLQYGTLKSIGYIFIMFVVMIGAVINIGIVSIVNRFSVDPVEDLRWQIFNTSEIAIENMLPFGSGPGSFPEVFRMFQPVDMPKFINHAHNDYYELVFDMGLIGVVLIALFFLIYILKWLVVLKQGISPVKTLQIASGVSVLLLLLHSYLDYNYYIPFNLLIFLLVSSIFFKCQGSPDHKLSS